jgi:type I restriction enzyme R subunit
LIVELDQRLQVAGVRDEDRVPAVYAAPESEAEVRQATAALLHGEVAAMNIDNFIVRPRRRLVERYSKSAAWTRLPAEAVDELSRDIAGLPSELDPQAEDAKRFDLLLLKLQLAVLRSEHSFERLRDQVKAIAGLLEEKSAIPMIRSQMPLILDLQTDEWWQDVTVPMLEVMRRRLRDLVKLIEKRERRIVVTDFEDEMGPETAIPLPGFSAGTDFEKFRQKARVFLRAHQDHVAVRKLRSNRALTASDLAELERLLAASGVGGAAEIERAKADSDGLGLFIRSLVGLDREAAKEAMAGFISGRTPTASQIEFIDLIVNHLTEHGVMEPALLYESPFTDITPHGPDGLFTTAQVDDLVARLRRIRATAVAA